ncbi:redoxin domain-containing protein [Hankyongella ginsenosidimutans]|uniref:Alkyl hydroperoxide reductase C n=1 Tax=Hankyongella ginsenosidimutans TaxID=1763828 RepID=A0A4D7CB82_9SPHN|nr:redoxin domain-containing protein [Hankyongella ginsenosidimutans]
MEMAAKKNVGRFAWATAPRLPGAHHCWRSATFESAGTVGDFLFAPGGFHPVCSTEFTELARRQAEFDAVGCMLVGLSVDSLHSHWAWIRALQEVFGVQVRFPIVEDPSMAIGRAYGMIDEQSRDSTTMRTTFFIDPEGVIRATTCYPHDVGRSVEEMLRLLKALQRSPARRP